MNRAILDSSIIKQGRERSPRRLWNFIALAKIKNAVLFTDDNGMHHHAGDVGAQSVLVRETDVEQIENFFSIGSDKFRV